jgi:ankyrin repeat protein
VRIERWTKEVNEFAHKKLNDDHCALTAAQFVIARSHGFASWPKFARHIQELETAHSPTAQFEAAADAIVSGDSTKLQRLLKENPALIRARSSREHHATLLHYVSANGVEGYRQRTPKNAVETARILLEAGAEVDATCDVYGGDCTTLGLVATSVHPERAGVQEALMQVLIDHGAEIERPNAYGNRQSAILDCIANGRLAAARYLASRGAKLGALEAAIIGDLETLKRDFEPDGSLKQGVTQGEINAAFTWACLADHRDVINFLLERGVDLGFRGGEGETGLHWAAHAGHLELVKLLIARGAPLEVQNVYGGTPLGQALWSAFNAPRKGHPAIVEALLAAGAKATPEDEKWIAKLRSERKASS